MKWEGVIQSKFIWDPEGMISSLLLKKVLAFDKRKDTFSKLTEENIHIGAEKSIGLLAAKR